MKVYGFTLGFCPARVLEASLQSLRETKTAHWDAHYFLDQHYPLRREENLEQLRRLARENDLIWLDGGDDLGMCAGFNYVMKQMPLQKGDIIIGYDPDSRPEARGWDQAMLDVLTAEPIYDLVATAQCFTMEHIYPMGIIRGIFRDIAGSKVFQVEMPSLDMWTVAAFRTELIEGRELSSPMAYWGGSEGTVRSWLLERGKTYAYLLEYQENNGHAHLGDPEYRAYKDQLLAGYRGSFAEWLKR